jgi:hypothetical protein
MSKKFEPYEINKDDIVKAGKQGYYYCVVPDGHPYGERRSDRKKRYLYLHRARMENKIHRYLHPDEQVDHKDKDKSHNSISNLVLTSRGPHQKHHSDNGNHFWKKSPMNKPKWGKKSASVIRVICDYLSFSDSSF